MTNCKEIDFTDYAALDRNYTIHELAEIYKKIILDITRTEKNIIWNTKN